jgi:DNA-binding transcriptional LysR family regulator
LIKLAVKEGLGVSFVSRFLVREEIERGQLVAFHVSGAGQMLRPIHVVQYNARELTPEGSAFMTLMVSQAEALAADWQSRAANTSGGNQHGAAAGGAAAAALADMRLRNGTHQGIS